MSFAWSLARLSLRRSSVALSRTFHLSMTLRLRSTPFSTSSFLGKDLRIAIIGQSVFGQEVYNLLQRQGKNIVGVFTVPDQNGRPDPLAAQAEKDGVQLFKFERWRKKGGI